MSSIHTKAADSLDAQIGNVIAKQEIADAVLRYCRGVDRHDEALIRSAYHSDAWEHHGAYRGHSVDDFVNYANGRSDLFQTVCHYVCNQLITVEGNTASSETYSIALHEARGDTGVSQTIFGGRYVDRFEKRDGRWAIADRVVICDWSRVDPIAPWERQPLFAQGTSDHSDLSYEHGNPGPGQRLRTALAGAE